MIRTAQVPTRELSTGEARLDAFYYAGAGRAVRLALPSAAAPVQQLDQVARPPFMGVRFARHYVHDPEFGVPFLGPSDMRLADTRNLPLLSRLRTSNLAQLRVHRGWILISRSGVVGNFAYVRDDMDGLVSSDDIIRVAPLPNGAPVGYLYAFLQSEAGLAMLRQSTYGGVVPHIEPHHVAGLPIPRLGHAKEIAIHDRIEAAAAKRVAANRQLEIATRLVHEVTGIPSKFSVPRDHAFATGTVPAQELLGGTQRLDAYHYIGHAGEVRTWQASRVEMRALGAVTAQIFNPPIFKRIRVEDGVPYLLGAEVYDAHPRASTRIARRTPNLDQYFLRRDMIVFEDAGQRYGLLGTPVYIGRTLAGCTATNNMTRIVSHSTEDAGYLFALLNSDYGRRLILRESYGTSLPHILPKHVADTRIPWPDEIERASVAKEVLEAIELRDLANDLEDEAQALLTQSLDDAVPAIAPSADGRYGG